MTGNIPGHRTTYPFLKKKAIKEGINGAITM